MVVCEYSIVEADQQYFGSLKALIDSHSAQENLKKTNGDAILKSNAGTDDKMGYFYWA